jgi:hypothetical protein
MNYPEHFIIKNIRMKDMNTCEIYMLNEHKKVLKGWSIHCGGGLIHLFHDRMNHLLQSQHPFQELLQLKQYYKIEVLH